MTNMEKINSEQKEMLYEIFNNNMRGAGYRSGILRQIIRESSDTYLTGSYLLWCLEKNITKEEPKWNPGDIDVFTTDVDFPNKLNDAFNTHMYINGEYRASEFDYIKSESSYNFIELNDYDKSSHCNISGVYEWHTRNPCRNIPRKLQVIVVNGESAMDVINKFDFNILKSFYDGINFYTPNNTLKNIEQRKINFPSEFLNCNGLINTYNRSIKYANRGYTITYPKFIFCQCITKFSEDVMKNVRYKYRMLTQSDKNLLVLKEPRYDEICKKNIYDCLDSLEKAILSGYTTPYSIQFIGYNIEYNGFDEHIKDKFKKVFKYYQEIIECDNVKLIQQYNTPKKILSNTYIIIKYPSTSDFFKRKNIKNIEYSDSEIEYSDSGLEKMIEDSSSEDCCSEDFCSEEMIEEINEEIVNREIKKFRDKKIQVGTDSNIDDISDSDKEVPIKDEEIPIKDEEIKVVTESNIDELQNRIDSYDSLFKGLFDMLNVHFDKESIKCLNARNDYLEKKLKEVELNRSVCEFRETYIKTLENKLNNNKDFQLEINNLEKKLNNANKINSELELKVCELSDMNKKYQSMIKKHQVDRKYYMSLPDKIACLEMEKSELKSKLNKIKEGYNDKFNKILLLINKPDKL